LLLFPLVFTGCRKDDITALDDSINNGTDSEVVEPPAHFSFTGANDPAPRKITFTKSSGTVIAWNWDFGDGSTSVLASPSHIYTSGGSYSATLTAYGEENTQDIISKTVAIGNKPTMLKITSLKIWSIPFVNDNGVSWDLLDGPDVYFKIYKGSSELMSSTYYSDVTSGDLPLNWTNVFPLYLTSLYSQHTISVYDYEIIGGADDFIGGYSFAPSNSMPTNGVSSYPSYIDLSLSGSDVSITLYVEWI
ncbi:MAG: PKD domain-containing protein, partial [Bacteroidetes bacterium]|nr:PKD domain-containing protein [Bacteroidota bacterium]